MNVTYTQTDYRDQRAALDAAYKAARAALYAEYADQSDALDAAEGAALGADYGAPLGSTHYRGCDARRAAARAAFKDDYEIKRSALETDYKATRAALWADYEAGRVLTFADALFPANTPRRLTTSYLGAGVGGGPAPRSAYVRCGCVVINVIPLSVFWMVQPPSSRARDVP